MSSFAQNQRKRGPVQAIEREMETVQWQGKTYKLPAKLTEGTDDRYECERYLENTLRGINSNESAPFSQRLMLLDDRFNFLQLMNEVNGILVNLHDFT
jgi:hypothetical protein